MITTEREKIKVLYELKPISGGYAGIPYVTRTVFEMLHTINEIEVHGLLNTFGLKIITETFNGVLDSIIKYKKKFYSP